MTRLLPIPDRDDVLEEDLPAYDAVVERQAGLWSGSELNSNTYFGALLNSPQLAKALADLGRVVRTAQSRGAYTDAERELVDMVLSADLDYWTIGVLHLPDALAVGVRAEAMTALVEGRPDGLTPAEAQLTEYVRAVVAGTVSDSMFAGLVVRLGERGAVEFTGFVGFLLCTFRLWQALGVPDLGRERFEADLARLADGADLPDPEARLG